MFNYIKGILADKNLTENFSVTIDVNGIGFLIFVSAKDFNNLSDLNSELKLYTVLIHKEDSMTLYGFLKKDARDVFNMLNSISGVGPKMAMQILSNFETTQLISCISNENTKELTKTKGVGSKLAQKIVIELKDKFDNFKSKYPDLLYNSVSNISGPTNQEVIDVLISLGYQNEEIKEAISYASKSLNTDATSENILKIALKFLSA